MNTAPKLYGSAQAQHWLANPKQWADIYEADRILAGRPNIAGLKDAMRLLTSYPVDSPWTSKVDRLTMEYARLTLLRDPDEVDARLYEGLEDHIDHAYMTNLNGMMRAVPGLLRDPF